MLMGENALIYLLLKLTLQNSGRPEALYRVESFNQHGIIKYF